MDDDFQILGPITANLCPRCGARAGYCRDLVEYKRETAITIPVDPLCPYHPLTEGGAGK